MSADLAHRAAAALLALHDAGRIRTPWTSGTHWTMPSGHSVAIVRGDATEILGVEPELLLLLRWVPSREGWAVQTRELVEWAGGRPVGLSDPRTWVPDLSDRSTVDALAALAGEALSASWTRAPADLSRITTGLLESVALSSHQKRSR